MKERRTNKLRFSTTILLDEAYGSTSKFTTLIIFETTFDRRLGDVIIRKFKIAVGFKSIILALFCIIKYAFTFLPKSSDNYRRVFYPLTL